MVRSVGPKNNGIRLIFGERIFLLIPPKRWIEFPTEEEALEWVNDNRKDLKGYE